MRLSTRDLFVVITFVAVIAWCAGQVGYDNGLFWMSTVVSLILGAIFAAYSGARDGRFAIVIAALVLVGFCTMPFGSIAVILVAGTLFLASFVCVAVPITSFRVRGGIAMACIAAVFACALTLGAEYARQLVELREQFPIESLQHRLAYEPPVNTAPPVLRVSLSDRLTDDEEEFSRMGNRDWQLARIHERRYEQFVRATGFGVVRMRRPRRESIERTPLRDIAFSNQTVAPSEEDDYRWRGGGFTASTDPAEILHDSSRFDFLDTEGYGAVLEPRTKVAGFVDHAFHHHPFKYAKGQAKWSIDRVELVSLLKFDKPRVYVLDHLPRMDQLNSDSAPTRPLNAFETSALQQLQTNEDLVVAEHGDQVQMLGSLRAAKQCLECHNVQRGELLGAFSYRLTLTEAVKEDEESPTTDLAADDATGERSP